MSGVMGEDEICHFDIHTAASLGDLQFIKENNFSSNPNSSGWTPLMYGCVKGYYEVVKYLLESGADVNETNCQQKNSALILAVQSGDLNLVKIVISKENININYQDANGWTALFHAISLGRDQCAGYLIKNGANIYIRDKSGQTVEDLANKLELGSTSSYIASMASKMNENSNNQKKQTAKTISKPSPLHGLQESQTRRIDLQFGKTYTYSPSKQEKENVAMPSPRRSVIPSLISPLRKLHPNSGTSTKTSTTVPSIIIEGENAFNAKGSTDPVYIFLKVLNLTKYWSIFQEEEVDFETLLTFEESNLIDLGIKAYGPRRKIIFAIQQYKTSNPTAIFDGKHFSPEVIFGLNGMNQ